MLINNCIPYDHIGGLLLRFESGDDYGVKPEKKVLKRVTLAKPKMSDKQLKYMFSLQSSTMEGSSTSKPLL